MRLRIRDAQREFGGGVAVVCGAWHVPALRRRTGVTADRALLKGLPKVKTDVTWVPWTHRRLSRAGGVSGGTMDRPALQDLLERPTGSTQTSTSVARRSLTGGLA